MILFSREVLFVHNPKTAGTSLLAYLEKALPEVRKAGTPELGTHHPHLSCALEYACAQTGNRPWDFKRILVCVRDPVERERSMYAYFRSIAHLPGTRYELNDPALEYVVRTAAASDPDTYIRRLFYGPGIDVWKSRRYYESDDGKTPPALRLLRTTHLDSDLGAALRGVEHNDVGSIPHTNKSDSSAVYFSARTAAMIRHSYAWMAPMRIGA